MGRSKNAKGKSRKPRRRIPRPATALTQDAKRNRITQKRPIANEGEPPEDIAVFDVAVRSSLPADVAAQATTVRDALDLLSQSRDDEALDRLRMVPRRSPLSEWRLFARGLADWYADRFDEAERAWEKLDPSRRPARIVAVLRESRRDPSASADDPQIASAARSVRTLRVERPAFRDAAARLSQLREPKGIWISGDTIEWLKGFVHEYRWMDPDLVQTLETAAVHRAAMQPFVDLFTAATRTFRGPEHDPSLTLLSSHYEATFEDGDSRQARLLKTYLTKDLPRCETLSPVVRGAIASHLHLESARELDIPSSPFGHVMRTMGRFPPEDPKEIEDHFRRAIDSYPPNREAHEDFVAWVRTHAEDERASKSAREKFAKKMPGIMETWSEALPDDVEPRLWLVDHYLEEEQLEQAKPHVEWLSRCRHEDPRVRATPWKWEILEAMRLARRKAWLTQAEQRLDAAEAMWPDWLPQRWLPYLRAAMALRGGDEEGFRARREEILLSAPGPLTDAVMMLAAAQKVRIPNPELKTFRQPVEQAVGKLQSVSMADLMDVGSFFWDLHRVTLLYPAYRMHGSKIGRELGSRLDGKTKPASPQCDAALLWMGQFRFWSTGYECNPPRTVLRALTENPFAAAAILQAAVGPGRNPMVDRDLPIESLISIVRSAAKTAPDRFYRYLFVRLADLAEEALSKNPVDEMFPGFAGFASAFASFADGFDEDDDDDDDDWDFGSGDPDDSHDFRPDLDPDGIPAFFSSGDDDGPDPFSSFSRFARESASDSKAEPQRANEAADPDFRRKRPKDPMGRHKKNKKSKKGRTAR